MRKLLRSILRHNAEKIGVKPSLYVWSEFNKYQIKKYGKNVRRDNRIKGTRKRKTWKNNLIFAR